MRHLLLRRRHWTRRSGGVRVVSVAGWATEPVLALIHGETGGGGGAAGWGMDDAVGGRWRIEGGGAGLLGGGWVVAVAGSRSALRTKAAKTFEAGSHQVRHIRQRCWGNNADAIIKLGVVEDKGRSVEEQEEEEEQYSKL